MVVDNEMQAEEEDLRLDEQQAKRLADSLIEPFAAFKLDDNRGGETASLSSFFFGNISSSEEAGAMACSGFDLFAIAAKSSSSQRKPSDSMEEKNSRRLFDFVQKIPNDPVD
jgi:hypothetical protein